MACSEGCSGCSGECTSVCGGSCSNNCYNGCDDSCGGGCSVCTTTCTGCSHSCSTGCEGGCKGCSGGCSGCSGCGNCSGECGTLCVGACEGRCDNACQSESDNELLNNWPALNTIIMEEDINRIIKQINIEIVRRASEDDAPQTTLEMAKIGQLAQNVLRNKIRNTLNSLDYENAHPTNTILDRDEVSSYLEYIKLLSSSSLR